MTNEQRVRVDRLERYLITDRGKTYTRVRVNDLDTVLSLIKAQQEEISKYKTLYERALSDVVKTDKQIDLMAECMSKQDIEEDICMKNRINADLCNENYTNCKDCIKQYFENKVNSSEQK